MVFLISLTVGSRAQMRPEIQKVWLFLTDKGPQKLEKMTQLENGLPDYQKKWRARFMSDRLVDSLDLPVNSDYLDQIRPWVVTIRYASKLLNAVSVEVLPENLDLLARLPFIREITPVSLRYSRPEPVRIPYLDRGFSQVADYMDQIRQISVDQLHTEGYHGQGVRIGILDTGFDLSHYAFGEMKIIYQYDVINNDTIVKNESGQDVKGQDSHGTNCLSILGGKLEGKLLGPAYQAEFILIKSEILSDEKPIEEDYYVRGLEICADSGAIIISTSLGYNDWYTYTSFDGQTTVTAKAVNLLAEKRDILVVVAIGNEGNSVPHSLITPSDSPWALAVGAVKNDGQIASFSSTGPSYDGRIKPDILAQGVMTYHVFQGTTNLISQGSGTSYATPLVAGACALIRQKNPSWNVHYLLEKIRSTGSLSDQPTNQMGYGIMDAYQASVQFKNIKGYVINSDSMKLENVRVVLSNQDKIDSVFTDAQGYFSFDAERLSGLLTIFHPGYSPGHYTVSEQNETQDFITIMLQPFDQDDPICYPNPASSFFTVQFYHPVQMYQLRVFNVAGDCLLDHHLENWQKNPVFTYAEPGILPEAENVFTVSPLHSGVYILSISADQKHYRHKLMIK